MHDGDWDEMEASPFKETTTAIKRPAKFRSITQAKTPTRTTFQNINIYQFTAANPTGQNRHVDHNGELDQKTKEQPNYNAGGPELRTPGVPMGVCSTSQ